MTTSEDQAGISGADAVRGAGIVAGGVAAATLLDTGTASAESDQVHPNVRLIQDFYGAYGSGDLNKLRQFFATDIRWTIPGHHPLSGTKVGVDEVIAFFGELGKAGFRAEPISLAVDKEWVIDLHRGWSTNPEGLDITWALAFKIRGRRIVEAINFASDQHAADQFFWKAYKLDRIPNRLDLG